ncbi:MAG TPA: signal recognition particle protein [Gammaproteobacteria bacterium]|nr:signal recognition particle protein [Gammaproteobacteria bacterium]
MFDSLTEKLTQSLKRITGQGRLTEDNIKETLQEVRLALLEADVALPVINDFLTTVRSKALGAEVLRSLKPGEALVKIVHDAILELLGSVYADINLQTQPPAIILLAGLQGSGKTTTTAKLANWLKTRKNKSVLVTSADIYRPAAIAQLKTLAEQIGVEFYPSDASQSPVAIAKGAIQQAKSQFIDVVLIDTAGRLHIDQEMMAEIREIHQAINPIETLFVVDSMTGQDAANTAKAFNDALPLTGIILTKIDGDARGGAALSIRHITGKPIKFVGVGEKIDALDAFYPDRMASRILGMGDILSLVEEVQRKVDQKQAKKLAKKIKKGGKEFDLNDFLMQLQQMRNMGGLSSILSKFPGMAIPPAAQNMVSDKLFKQMEAIINSMTPKERRHVELIGGSRKRRIAAGSGTQVQDINRMLKQFLQMQKMMKKLKGNNMMRMMRNLNMLKGGGMPPTGPMM